MEPARNLLIVHTPVSQDISDWRRVKAMIDAQAPDIEVRIVDNKQVSPTTEEWQITRPSLVFSPNSLREYSPRGGTIFVGKHIDKLEQMQRLSAAGIPVPQTAELLSLMKLHESTWGEFVILKPLYSQNGTGVRITRVEEAVRRLPALQNARDWDGEERRDGGRVLVQRFIDHTDDKERPVEFRALMLFGKPLYLHRLQWLRARRPVADIARDFSGEIAGNAPGISRRRDLVKDNDVLDLAARACAVFPEIPVFGMDIVREKSTGELFVIEINPAGNWHLSSGLAINVFPKQVRRATYRQFNALQVIADVLIEKTRAEAI